MRADIPVELTGDDAARMQKLLDALEADGWLLAVATGKSDRGLAICLDARRESKARPFTLPGIERNQRRERERLQPRSHPIRFHLQGSTKEATYLEPNTLGARQQRPQHRAQVRHGALAREARAGAHLVIGIGWGQGHQPPIVATSGRGKPLKLLA